ncbi:MAG TPA: HdeD family acid-resistance protein [Steroidobacteraceae bacterium]
MSTDYTGAQERRHTAEIFRDNWLWLVLLGAVLILAGAAAILVPAVSEIPASRILGSVLVISGIIQIVQSAKMLSSIGFIWHMLLGILATVGGALIYMDPFAGVVAITLLIAVIFAFHGLTQIVFAIRVRGQSGWYWFLVSGCIALVVSVLLVMKLPYSHSFTPATIAGISLGFAGCAYVAMALASRKAGASDA